MKVTKNKSKSTMTRKEIEQWAKIPMKQKLINLPKDLFKKIEASAKKNARSVNKEIQVLLAQAITTTKNQ